MRMQALRLEHSEPAVEAAYHDHYLPADIRQITIGVWVWVLPYLAFSYIDYLLFYNSPLLHDVLLARTGYAIISLILLIFVQQRIRQPKMFDGVVLGWALTSVTMNMLVNILRPRMFMASYIFDLVQVFSFYVFIPNRVLIRGIPALVLSSFDLLLAYTWGTSTSQPEIDRQALLVAFTLANAVGIIFSKRILHSRMTEFIAHNQEKMIRQELERLAATDPLTGVYNRRRILELAAEEFYRFRRYSRPFSLVILDMDGFKRVNDTFGHILGDAVLIEFAQMIASAKREADTIGRMGGDEFCLVLPETSPQQAFYMAERIRKKCEGMEIAGAALDVRVTASIGITQVLPQDVHLDAVFSRADVALYRAKNEGRNRTVIL